MNNFIEVNKPLYDSERYFGKILRKAIRLCFIGYLHLNKRFDAWENFRIVAGGWGI